MSFLEPPDCEARSCWCTDAYWFDEDEAMRVPAGGRVRRFGAEQHDG